MLNLAHRMLQRHLRGGCRQSNRSFLAGPVGHGPTLANLVGSENHEISAASLEEMRQAIGKGIILPHCSLNLEDEVFDLLHVIVLAPVSPPSLISAMTALRNAIFCLESRRLYCEEIATILFTVLRVVG